MTTTETEAYNPPVPPSAPPPGMRRLVTTPVAPQLLVDLMRTGHTSRGRVRCVSGVPRTAELVAITHDPTTNLCHFVWHDASFAPVPLGGVLPRIEVVLSDAEADGAP